MSTSHAPTGAGGRLRTTALAGGLAIAGVLALVLVPRENTDAVRVIDPAPALAHARAAASFAVVMPRGLPDSWRPTTARTDVRGGTVHWHLGYTTPEGGYVGVDQSDRPSRLFLAEMTQRGPAAGVSVIEGQLWIRTYAAARNQRSIWWREGSVTTVVSGNTSWQDVETFATDLHLT